MRSGEAKSPAMYDTSLFLHKNQKSPRFNKLNLEVDRDLFSHRSSFDYIKDFAVARLEKTIIDQLDILALEDKCDFPNMEKLSENIFTWSSKDYLKRRALKNCVWIDVIRIHSKGDCLERFKLHTSLKEIKMFLKLIFQRSQTSEDNFDLETLVCKPLREAERNLDILEILCDEKAELQEILKEQKILINARLHIKRSFEEQRLLFGIEESVTTAQTWSPIQMRFETNWYQDQTAQVKLRSDLRESNLQREIGELKFKIFLEEMSGDNIRDTYYISVEQFKHEIELLQTRFNFKLDEIDNKINYTQSEISKMVEQRKILSQEIERFREEIKNRLEKDEIEREKHELERWRLEKKKRTKTRKRRPAKSDTKAKYKLKHQIKV